MKVLRKLMVIIASIVLGVSVGMLIQMGRSYYTAHEVRENLQHRFELSMQRMKAFMNFEKSIRNYASQPNSHTKNAIITATQNLNQALQMTEKTYGLAAKRWLDLFKVWEYQSEQKIFTLPSHGNKNLWNYQLDSYQQLIEKIVSKEDQAYKNQALRNLLYPIWFASKSMDRSTLAKVRSIYQNHAKSLIPASVEKLRQENYLLGGTPPPLSLQSPENVADNIAFIQYGSRYVPLTVKTDTSSLCDQLQHPWFGSQEAKDMLAVCVIARERLQDEADAAQKKYGSLTYSGYFKRYVSPLIPKYEQALKTKAQSNNLWIMINACNPSMQPVIRFRDPSVDAQVAAYEIYGYKYCQGYFKDRTGIYAQMQFLRYASTTPKKRKLSRTRVNS